MILTRSHDCPRCGPGHDNLCYITYDTGEHCFSCGVGSSKPGDYFVHRPTPLEIKRNVFTPTHTTNIQEFSATALEWLYSYYVYEPLIKQYRIAYCPPQCGKDESILLPLLDGGGEMIEYQRRFFPQSLFWYVGGKKEFIYSRR